MKTFWFCTFFHQILDSALIQIEMNYFKIFFTSIGFYVNFDIFEYKILYYKQNSFMTTGWKDLIFLLFLNVILQNRAHLNIAPTCIWKTYFPIPIHLLSKQTVNWINILNFRWLHFITTRKFPLLLAYFSRKCRKFTNLL